MPEAITNILNQLKNALGKINRTQKIILAGALVFFLVITGVMFSVSTEQPLSTLFEDIEQSEFADITAKLKAGGYKFSTSGGDTIMVRPEQKDAILMTLAQEKLLPTGVAGWDLFDKSSWDETKFDKDTKMQRAIRGALKKAIESLRKVKKAVVNIAVPPTELFENNITPVKAAVIVHLAPGIEELKPKEIQGIITIVQRTVPKLKRENISLADSNGNILSSEYLDIQAEKELELRIVKMKLAIQEQERVKKLVSIDRALSQFYPDGRYEIYRLDLQLNWDLEKYKEEVYSPIVMKKDNPKTPYDETEVKDSLPVSDQSILEKFLGRGFTPDGPAGTEPNIPPGYKDTDYQKALYEKEKKTRNHAINKRNTDVEKQPWTVEKVTLAVVLDGRWDVKGPKEDYSGYEREYQPVAEEDLKTMREVLGTAIGYEKTRGDKLAVETLQKDRTAQFAKEDEALRRERMIRNILIAALITILTLFIFVIIWRAIKRELERRRRRREEEEARRQQMMREAALQAADDEGAEYELSADDRARQEMLENAINLAREKPEEVALLLRTWLSEE